MKNLDTPMDDELRPEYDLQTLQVRQVGAGRKKLSSSNTLQLEEFSCNDLNKRKQLKK